MASIVRLSLPFLNTFTYAKPSSHLVRSPGIIVLKSYSFQPLLASRRTPNYSQVFVTPEFDDDLDVDEEEDEDEDRSLDLLVRFVQNVFRKVSKRARKAVRSVLPVSIPTKLVGFSVNGVLILAFLWILKAFLEVVCTLGSVVFVSILLIRGIWTGVTYMQESRERRINENVDDQRTWTGAQPVI